jgi:hypothetical protein
VPSRWLKDFLNMLQFGVKNRRTGRLGLPENGQRLSAGRRRPAPRAYSLLSA